MSQYNDSGYKTFLVSATIPRFSRVKLDSNGALVIAGLTDKDIGTIQRDAVAGDYASVKLRTASGTHKMIAIEAMSAGVTVYTETDGKVQDTAQATSFQVGTTLEAATADGDIIEVLYNAHGDSAAA